MLDADGAADAPELTGGLNYNLERGIQKEQPDLPGARAEPATSSAGAGSKTQNVIDQTQTRLNDAHRCAGFSRAVLRSAREQSKVSRGVGYNGLVMETRFVRDDIERKSRDAARFEREQLVLGLRLLALREP